MTEKECRKLVKEHMLHMMRALGVSGWTIDVWYDEIEERADTPKRFASQMELSVNWRYEKAVITINPEVLRDKKDLLQGLRHELIHVVLSPFNAYDTHIRKHVGEQPSETWSAINDAWHGYLESAVLNVERILDWGLDQTPAKLSATARRRWGDEKPKKKKKRKKR